MARVATVAEAARVGDIVVVSVPAAAFASLPAAPLAGKVVICTSGDTARSEGRDQEAGYDRVTIPGLLQRELPASYVVAAFSTVALASVPLDGSPSGTPGRRALPLAGDFPAAKKIIADLYDRLGCDAVEAGTLSENWRSGPRPAWIRRPADR